MSVHPEWLFQPPHLDAGTELERDSIDSLFRWPFINSVGLEAHWSSSLDYLSPGGVPAIAKSVSDSVIQRLTQGRSYDSRAMLRNCQVCL